MSERPAGPLGDDDALITEDETAATPAPARAAAGAARPERRIGGEGPPPDDPREPATDLERCLAAALAGISIEFRSPPVGSGDPVVIVPADRIGEAARALKSDPDLAIDYPRCLSGVDLGENLEVVYHLYSTRHGHQIWLKVRVPADRPVVPSVTPVWRGADWHEREAAELFGFEFPGHPGLKLPFLLDEGFEGHPLLKSFELEPEVSNVNPH